MDVTLSRPDLYEELQLIQGVLERRATIPILSNILLTAQGDQLKLAATDLDVTLFTSCSATVRQEGRATIHGKVFFDLVRSLPQETLDVTLTDGRIEVRSGTFHSHIASLDPTDFPTLPEIPEGQGFAVPLPILHRLIDSTIYAVSSEEGHFQYNAAMLLLAEQNVTMVGTDGHRLAYAQLPCSGGTPPFPQQLLPRKVLHQLRRIDHEGASAYIARGESHIAFRLGDRVLLSRALEARFPQYERLLTRDHPYRARLQRDEFVAALRRVVILTSEKTHGVELRLDEDSLSLASVGFDLGGAQEVVNCQFHGPTIRLLVNGQYLLDFATAVTAAEIELNLRDDEAPLLLAPVDPDPPGSDVACVIMPIRL